jgi:hypothetical protein
MAALRGFSVSLVGWGQYLFGLTALGALLAPRAARWGRFWLRARLDERLLLARAVGATTQAS